MLKYHYKLQLKLARYKLTNKPAHWLQITTHKLMAAHSGFGIPQSAQKLLLGSAQICSATSQFDKATCIAFCIESIHCLHSCSDSVMKLQRKINTFIVNVVSASATKWQKLEGDKTRKYSWLLLWKIFLTASLKLQKHTVHCCQKVGKKICFQIHFSFLTIYANW